MNAWIADFLSNSAAQRMAWALIHFVWQGTAVAVLLAMGLRLLRRNSSQVRWAVSCGALGLMVVLPVVTARMVSVETPSAVAVERVAEAPAPPGRAALAESSPSPRSTPAPDKDPISPPVAMTEDAIQPSEAAADSVTSWPRQTRDIFGAALPWAFGLWLVGVVGMALWHLGGWLELRALKTRGVSPAGPAILEAFSRLALRLRIRQRTRLLVSVRIVVPTVIGWLRPVILLPAQVVSGLTGGQLEAVLIHELAHIRRYDCLVRLIQAVVETLLFYHPAVWWVSRCIRQESEHCCDELAVDVCGDRRGYVRALARVAEFGRRKRPLAAAVTGGRLLPRIRRIVGLPDRDSVGANCWLAGIVIMAGLLAAGLIVYGGVVQAQTQQPVAQPAQKTATASAASKVSASPGKKELADAHAFLQSLLNPQELTPKDKARIKKLIAALGHDDWRVREKATVDLSGLGPEALPLVQAAAKSKDHEVVIRTGRIVEAIEARTGDPGDKLAPVIDVLTAGRDKRLVGMLIELLGHASVGARYAAEYGLRRITGKAFGYNAYGDVGRRADALEKWRKWWKESKAKFSFETAASQSKQFGLLICDSPGRILMAATPAGKVVWTRKLERRINGLAGLPNGHVLVGYDSGERTVEEFDRDFKPVWNADEVREASGRVSDVSRLANGNTLIAYVRPRGHVVEVTPAGKIVWQKTDLRTPASAQRLVNGNTLICEHKENRVIEVDRAGSIVWQKAVPKRPHDAEKLANGNVLIGTSGKRVVEVNRAGKTVWERRCSGEALGICRLPDGTTGIFIEGEGAILVDRSGKKTRELYKSKTVWGRIRVAPTMPLKGNRPGVRPSSRPATRPGEWGKPLEGVQVRLRNVEGDLYADVRNTGKRKFSLGAIQQMAKLERDGRVFPYARDFAVIRSPFGPGREYRDIRIHPESFVAVLPGKHVLRVAFAAEPPDGDAGSSVEAWSNAVEIEIVPAEPPAKAEKTTWGASKEGLRCRMIPPRGHVGAGKAPKLIVEVENASRKPLKWECRDEITLLLAVPGVVGRWTAPRFKVLTDEGEVPPAGTYRIDAGARVRLITQLPKLTKPGRYQVECQVARHNLRGGKEWGEKGVMECPPIVLSVVAQGQTKPPNEDPTSWPAGPWGKAVEGMQVRLFAGGSLLNPGGKVPHLSLDARNTGKRRMRLILAPEHMEFEVDGTWYKATTTNLGEVPVLPFAPGNRWQDVGISPLPQFRWRSRDGKQLSFGPGKHVIRAAVTVHPAPGGKGKPVRLVTNAIQPGPAGKLPRYSKSPPTTQPTTIRSGQYDKLILAMLRTARSHLHLRKTPLKAIAPELHVERPKEATSWDRAVAYADRHLAKDSAKRALFLWSFLKHDDPATRLGQLKLEPTGNSMGTGSARSVEYYVAATYTRKPVTLSSIDGSIPPRRTEMIVPHPKVVLTFWTTHRKDGRLVGDGRLSLRDRQVGRIAYGVLRFDSRGLLVGFRREQDASPPGVTVYVGGNTSGTGGRDFFHAGVETRKGLVESIHFDSDLRPFRRTYDASKATVLPPATQPTQPAGPGAFGPVVERVVAYRKGFPSEAVPEPGPMYLDLDTGAYVKFKVLPAYNMVRGAGVDVYYERQADGTGMTLARSNLQVQPLSDKTGWDSSPKHVWRVLVAASPYALIYPGRSTLAFKTGDGGFGILQILGFTKDRRGIRIRYKLVQRPKAGRSATPRATTQPANSDRRSHLKDVKAKDVDKRCEAILAMISEYPHGSPALKKVPDGGSSSFGVIHNASHMHAWCEPAIRTSPARHVPRSYPCKLL